MAEAEAREPAVCAVCGREGSYGSFAITVIGGEVQPEETWIEWLCVGCFMLATEHETIFDEPPEDV